MPLAAAEADVFFLMEGTSFSSWLLSPVSAGLGRRGARHDAVLGGRGQRAALRRPPVLLGVVVRRRGRLPPARPALRLRLPPGLSRRHLPTTGRSPRPGKRRTQLRRRRLSTAQRRTHRQEVSFLSPFCSARARPWQPRTWRPPPWTPYITHDVLLLRLACRLRIYTPAARARSFRRRRRGP